MECKICTKKFKSCHAISAHITRFHKITMKEYYDKFFKLKNEGFCKKCNHETKYRSFMDGYHECCSIKCSKNLTKKLKKQSQRSKIFSNKEESKKRTSFQMKKYWTEERKNIQKKKMLNGYSKIMNAIPRNPDKMKKDSEIRRQKLLNGQSLKMIKAIKKISNEEIKLRNMVKEIYSNCEFQYPVLRYSLDVAIPDKKIAIEYDGYYHFDTEEHKEYHKVRQEKIENEGWKFLRYTMFDKFPTLEKLKNDLSKLERK